MWLYSNSTLVWVSFLFGSIFGSFLNVVAYRVPKNASVMHPGSHCPQCKRRLGPRELVPILSWLWLHGTCKGCKSTIAIRYPVIELTTAGLFAATYLAVPTWTHRIVWDFFWLLMVATMGTDLTSMRVPNQLSYAGAVLTFGASVFFDIQTLQTAMVGAMVGFGMLVAIHVVSRGNMGLGDAKLYLSIGAMLGPLFAVESFVIASLSGALVGLLLQVTGLVRRREHIPFVPHIVVGVIVTVFFGHALTAWYLHRVLAM